MRKQSSLATKFQLKICRGISQSTQHCLLHLNYIKMTTFRPVYVILRWCS